MRIKQTIIYWLASKFAPYIDKEISKLHRDKLIQEHIDAGSNLFIQQPIVVSGRLQAGDNLSIAAFTHIWADGGVTIGDNVMIGSHCAIVSMDHDSSRRVIKGHNIGKPVVIGNNVWIGAHTVIFPGIIIGSGSIIGAGSVVRQNVAPGTVVAGVPSRLIYNREERIVD